MRWKEQMRGARVARALMRVVMLVLAASGACGCSERQMNRRSLQLSIGGEPVDCLIYVPHEYDRQDKSFPLVLFLHGAGRRGADLLF